MLKNFLFIVSSLLLNTEAITPPNLNIGPECSWLTPVVTTLALKFLSSKKMIKKYVKFWGTRANFI